MKVGLTLWAITFISVIRELVIAFLLVMGSSCLLGQTIDSTGNVDPIEDTPFNWKEQIFWGGGFGAQFGTSTIINAAPLVGIKVTDRLSFGTQASYTYANINYGPYRFIDHIVGGSVFSRYFIWNNLFAQGEAQMLNGQWSNNERSNVYALLAGGGYMFQIGNQGGFSIMALYNFTPDPYGVIRNPVINMGFTFGL
ncbi:MAG: hypothetical protein Salg2KO_15350 [Salibacteraceae bacterium]